MQLWSFSLLVFAAASCAGGGSVASAPPPSLPPAISVQVSPSSASVLLGNTVGYTASVSGTSNSSVGWTVDGVSGGNGQLGTTNAAGVYQAPAILPAPAEMQIAAISQANSAISATASVMVLSDVRVQISPAAATLGIAATQSFTAAIASAGRPSTAVTWAVSGPGCTGAACGTIGADGTYTAPGAVPVLPAVSVIATSVADPSKSAIASVQFTSTHTLVVTPSDATVALEQSQVFSASLDGAPTQAILWSVNGIPGGNSTSGTISNSPSENGLYLAPVNMPTGRVVTISAVSTAYPALSSSVTVQLTSNITVSIAPASSTRVPGSRQAFTATIAGTSNPQITWTVNGAPNGNATWGEICLSGSNPCLAPSAAAPAGSVDYLAPAAVPSPAQIMVSAVSVADPARFATAIVTITQQISVTISPQSLTLPPQQVQTLTASVLGAADQNVTWDVNGSVNGAIADGLICLPASQPCQAPSGPSAGPVEFRAPDILPSPNTVSVHATSEANPSAQGVALFTISTAPYISSIVPASLFAGAATPFGLRVMGVQFTPSEPGPGSNILINGTARATNCVSSTECDTTLNPADVAGAGSLGVSIGAAGSAQQESNAVGLIVVPLAGTQGTISLDSSNTVAVGMDITAVEPTLAGSDPPEQLSLLEIGVVDPQTGTCVLGAPPLVVTRPASGSALMRLCLFGTALDQAAQITFSGPATADLIATNLDTSLGGVLVEFDVTVPATAAPGARTLFVTTANQDRAALTAAVEVN